MARFRVERQIVEQLRQQLRQRSGEPDLGRLNDQQLATYNEWRGLHDRFTAQFRATPESYYRAIIDDDFRGPPLPHSIQRLIYRPSPTIAADTTTEGLRELYQRMCQL
ncbi:hypothetical protein [Mesorhizobium sp. M0030]|uniref:hypothetical protein n=1 Tax=Mesorhizobium sp. M0030 TaxID=2956851 RepID=UPI00333636EE